MSYMKEHLRQIREEAAMKEPCHITDEVSFGSYREPDMDSGYERDVQRKLDDEAEKQDARLKRMEADVKAIIGKYKHPIPIEDIEFMLRMAWTDGRLDGLQSWIDSYKERARDGGK